MWKGCEKSMKKRKKGRTKRKTISNKKVEKGIEKRKNKRKQMGKSEKNTKESEKTVETMVKTSGKQWKKGKQEKEGLEVIVHGFLGPIPWLFSLLFIIFQLIDLHTITLISVCSFFSMEANELSTVLRTRVPSSRLSLILLPPAVFATFTLSSLWLLSCGSAHRVPMNKSSFYLALYAFQGSCSSTLPSTTLQLRQSKRRSFQPAHLTSSTRHCFVSTWTSGLARPSVVLVPSSVVRVFLEPRDTTFLGAVCCVCLQTITSLCNHDNVLM